MENAFCDTLYFGFVVSEPCRCQPMSETTKTAYKLLRKVRQKNASFSRIPKHKVTRPCKANKSYNFHHLSPYIHNFKKIVVACSRLRCKCSPHFSPFKRSVYFRIRPFSGEKSVSYLKCMINKTII